MRLLTPIVRLFRQSPFLLVIIPASIVLAIGFIASLGWRMERDTPLMMYDAYLMDHFHYLPYRDFFEFNPPGTFAVYFLIAKIVGYSDIGYRLFDIFYTMLIMLTTWLWQRRFGWRVAWVSIVLWGVVYLSYGSGMSLQRDELLILPLTLSLVVASTPRLRYGVRCFAVGLIFALAGTIKPQVLIGFPVVLFYTIYLQRQVQNPDIPSKLRFVVRSVFFSFLGLSLVGIIVLLFMLVTGTLAPFVDVATNYWPLYNQLDVGFAVRVFPTFGRYIRYIAPNIFVEFTANIQYYIPLLLGLVIGFGGLVTRVQKTQVWLLVTLIIAYLVYVIIGNKFWDYHWIIYRYLLVLLISLAFVKPLRQRRSFYRALPSIAFVCLLLVIGIQSHFYDENWDQPWGSYLYISDSLADFFRKNTNPGDKVQPLDFVAGASHSLLLSQIEVATPYTYNFYFYQNVSNPYIQKLRLKFMDALKRSSPRYIVRFLVDGKEAVWVTGSDTTTTFAELDQFIDESYTTRLQTNDYIIYERK